MSDEQQLAIHHFAPRARVFGAQINEINRAVKFRSRHPLPGIAEARIDLHKRTWSQERIQRVVL
jgi:hypothetical protein